MEAQAQLSKYKWKHRHNWANRNGSTDTTEQKKRKHRHKWAKRNGNTDTIEQIGMEEQT